MPRLLLVRAVILALVEEAIQVDASRVLVLAEEEQWPSVLAACFDRKLVKQTPWASPPPPSETEAGSAGEQPAKG